MKKEDSRLVPTHNRGGRFTHAGRDLGGGIHLEMGGAIPRGRWRDRAAQSTRVVVHSVPFLLVALVSISGERA